MHFYLVHLTMCFLRFSFNFFFSWNEIKKCLVLKMTPSKSEHLYKYIWTAKAQPSPLSMMAGCTKRDIWLPVGGLAKYIRGDQKITTTLGIFSTSLFLIRLLGKWQAKYMLNMHNLFRISAKHDLKTALPWFQTMMVLIWESQGMHTNLI